MSTFICKLFALLVKNTYVTNASICSQFLTIYFAFISRLNSFYLHLKTAATSVRTSSAEGPASAVDKHQPSPQVTLPSGWRLVHADRDAGESDVADFDPGHDAAALLGTQQPLHHAFKTRRGPAD